MIVVEIEVIVTGIATEVEGTETVIMEVEVQSFYCILVENISIVFIERL